MEAQNPLVSVVVVTHNRPKFLASCLQSIAAQTWTNRELIVVLNPPDHESESLAERSATKVLRTHRNIGAFPAVNIAIANSTGRLLMVVDDDARFESNDALERLVTCLQRNPALTAVTCNIRGPCEGPPYRAHQLVSSFKSGFTMYRREVFTDLAGHVPDAVLQSRRGVVSCWLHLRSRRIDRSATRCLDVPCSDQRRSRYSRNELLCGAQSCLARGSAGAINDCSRQSRREVGFFVPSYRSAARGFRRVDSRLAVLCRQSRLGHSGAMADLPPYLSLPAQAASRKRVRPAG